MWKVDVEKSSEKSDEKLWLGTWNLVMRNVHLSCAKVDLRKKSLCSIADEETVMIGILHQISIVYTGKKQIGWYE